MLVAGLSDLAIAAPTILSAVILGVVGPIVQARVTGRNHGKAPTDADEQTEIDTERNARIGDVAEVKAAAALEAHRLDKANDAVVWLYEQFKKHLHD